MCSRCAHAITFNPLLVDPSDEAHGVSPRRGLAHCRQRKGNDPNALGYLASLAVSFEKTAHSSEAAEFKRARDALAQRVVSHEESWEIRVATHRGHWGTTLDT